MRLQSKMAEYRQRKAARRTASASGSSRGAASTGGSARGPSEFGPHSGGDTYGAGAGNGSMDGSHGHGSMQQHSQHGHQQHSEMLAAVADKDTTIQELSETVEVRLFPPSPRLLPPPSLLHGLSSYMHLLPVQFLELKVAKLEQLLRLKDSRIHTLTARLQSTQLAPGQ